MSANSVIEKDFTAFEDFGVDGFGGAAAFGVAAAAFFLAGAAARFFEAVGFFAAAVAFFAGAAAFFFGAAVFVTDAFVFLGLAVLFFALAAAPFVFVFLEGFFCSFFAIVNLSSSVKLSLLSFFKLHLRPDRHLK